MKTLKGIAQAIILIPLAICWMYVSYLASSNIQEFLNQYPTITFILQLFNIIPDDPIQIGLQVIGIVILIITILFCGIYLLIMLIYYYSRKGISWVYYKFSSNKTSI